MGRGDLTDEQWQQPHYHPKPRTGRTANDHRPLVNILWILRTGAPWQILPVEYGSRGTGPVLRWQQAGVATDVGKHNSGQTTRVGLIGRFLRRCEVQATSMLQGRQGTEHSALGISRGGLVPRYMCVLLVGV